VYSSDERVRLEHCGVVKWIDSLLAGALQARYEFQARERLGMRQPVADGMPTDEGNPYMESDGLDV